MPDITMKTILRNRVDRRRFLGRAGVGIAGFATALSGTLLS
jgi:hypothetical protein